VTIDAYTIYPEIAFVKSTSAFTTSNHFSRVFATHSLPSGVKTDSGDYMNENRISMTPVTPLWPLANAEAEYFNKVLEKIIRTAQIEGKDWKRELYQFLLNYRATPHITKNTRLPNSCSIVKFTRNYQAELMKTSAQ